MTAPPKHHLRPSCTPHLHHLTPSLPRSALPKTGRSLLPSLLPPDHLGETRPRYPGCWGSGVGSQARCAITLAVRRSRGRSVPVASATCDVLPASQAALPGAAPCALFDGHPVRHPCGTREGTLRGTRVHADAREELKTSLTPFGGSLTQARSWHGGGRAWQRSRAGA